MRLFSWTNQRCSRLLAWIAFFAGVMQSVNGSPEVATSVAPEFRIISIGGASQTQLTIRFKSETNYYYLLYSGSTVTQIDTPADAALGVQGIGTFEVSGGNAASFYRIRRVSLTEPLDTDRDQIDDVYELKYPAFLDPVNPADAFQDFDMDRRVNLQEYLRGTDPAVSQYEIRIQSIELLRVRFPQPVRVGYGPGARFYDEAIEFRLRVPPFEENDLEPFLYVRGTELRGHKVVRSPDQRILAFYAYEPALLPEGGCIVLTTDHRAGRSGIGSCQFRFSTNLVHAGEALDDTVRLDPASLDPPPTERWTGPEFIRPPIVTGGASNYSDVRFQLHDPQGRSINVIDPGDSLSISFTGLPQNRQIELYLLDDLGREWSYARLSADRAGRIPRTVIWYNTGVIGTTTRDIRWRPEVSFETFAEAYDYWLRHRLRMELRSDDGRTLQTVELPIAQQRTKPLLYPSNREGVLMNAVEVGREPLYATGTHFAPGSKILLFVVQNRYTWNRDDLFHDVTGPGFESSAERVELGPGQTSFTVPVWDAALARPGAYDMIARVVDEFPTDPNLSLRVNDSDVISFGDDTGVIAYQIIDGHIVMDIAGRELPGTSYFEFADVFERHEAVHGAVDPTDFPVVHPGGQYAAYYVVAHKSAAYWGGVSPALTDISGPGGSSQIEISQVKYWCINHSIKVIWPDPDPQQIPGLYDVIVDFGASPAQSSATYMTDSTYNVGVDFIDGYNKVGFCIVDDPATPGPFHVGKADHYDAVINGGANDPFDFSNIGFPLVRDWLTIRYPAQGTGVNQPLPAGNAKYPVVLFLHGRHRICVCGPCPSWSCYYDPNCAPANRIASHPGYNYILDTLASQGFIAISIDAFDIQPSQSQYNYEARGRLILEHLNRLKSWDQSGTDPWGGNPNFQNRIDMNNIAIVGHSRGGEGVVAAAEINQAEAVTYGHSIKAVVAIAPTDQQSGTPWDIKTAPYFLVLGSADGDLWDLQGFGTYDRAYPTPANPQYVKTIGYIYGANHNFFNTVWTPGAVGSDPCATDDAVDEGIDGPRITAAEQRQIALSTIVGFVRQQLMGFDKYREIFTGRLQLQAMRNDKLHWSYQDPDRKTVEDFETGPPGMNKNSLNGQVNFTPMFTTKVEGAFGGCSYHEAIGIELGWNSSGQEYENELPVAHRDFTSWSHLSFRVMQFHDSLNTLDANKDLIVKIIDGSSTTKLVHTDNFTPIPYPYLQYAFQNSSVRLCQMKTVRIPLRAFTLNNSGVDLTDIRKIVIRFQGTGLVGIDDIQITQ
jgi:dienelactone hydrolase